MRRKLVGANWKMNGSAAANGAWFETFADAPAGCRVVVCAPFVYLPQVVEKTRGTAIEPGAQNLSDLSSGAYTGEVSGAMLADIGCRWVIVGHSERRSLYGESDETVARKAAQAFASGLRPIVCVSETLEEREAGRTLAVIRERLVPVLEACTVAQLSEAAIAYEPVWAIGTGRSATPQQAQEVHACIRAALAQRDPAAATQVPVIYGGSVKADNAGELFTQPDIDGGLIGGASLKAAEFRAICAAAAQS